ncbi:GTPase HflX [Devosia epidermidihirudinis]|uniref:GTPase HflX n=1 Tax=Devosia epidermidihirudinis TaxID=1293439 RepID=A0A0F5QH07_9HYPH|nr:GTPase HflX [Devosia epidermidihirudinis]KKC39304.1 GTPase HflX [Devosia epidermidihirudinis]
MNDFDDEDEAGHKGGPQAFIDRREAPTRAGLVCPDVRGQISQHTIEARKAEFEGLAEAIRLDVIFSEVIKVREIKPSTFIGGGHAATLAERVKAEDIDLLLVDASLTAIQQRNLEKETGTKVLDRTALILEIFGERAATREGVLQVELAHLNYQKGRLVRSWTHLERQRGSGGSGFMGGPGETQIESDRRQIADRIVLLENRLEKVKKTRAQQRQKREGTPYPVVAIVGYTNAGKSSIFNKMTGAGVFAEDLLFATLDTTVRKLELPHGREVMLSDTVGFVADLPTDLVAAFRATLEEVIDADVILHVRDIANPDHPAQALDVLKVLGDLGVSAETIPIIEVWNKIDLLGIDPDQDPLAGVSPAGRVAASVPVSAKTGHGLDTLKLAVESALADKSRTYHVHVPHSAGSDIGWLHSHSEVISRDEPNENGSGFVVRVEPRHKTAFLERFNGRIESSDA